MEEIGCLVHRDSEATGTAAAGAAFWIAFSAPV
jgi:hypothetical protein